MIFDLSKTYVTRGGESVLAIRMRPELGDQFEAFIARSSGEEWRLYNERGVNVIDADLDIMTEDQQLHFQVGPIIDKLELQDKAIIRALTKDRQRLRAVRHVRDKVPGTGLRLATVVADRVGRG